MKKIRFTEEQFTGFIKQAEAGMQIEELCLTARPLDEVPAIYLRTESWRPTLALSGAQQSPGSGILLLCVHNEKPLNRRACHTHHASRSKTNVRRLAR